MARAATTTQYLHKECGAPIVWAKDGGKCTGAGCEATGLMVPDCDSIKVPLPRAEKATAPRSVAEVPLFGIEEIPGLAGDREAEI
jgi:hypothetical protein